MRMIALLITHSTGLSVCVCVCEHSVFVCLSIYEIVRMLATGIER